MVWVTTCLQYAMSDHALEEHCFCAAVILFISLMLFLVCSDEAKPTPLHSKNIQAYSFIIWICPSEAK